MAAPKYYELFHPFKGFITCPYIVIVSCIAFTAHERIVRIVSLLASSDAPMRFCASTQYVIIIGINQMLMCTN